VPQDGPDRAALRLRELLIVSGLRPVKAYKGAPRVLLGVKEAEQHRSRYQFVMHRRAFLYRSGAPSPETGPDEPEKPTPDSLGD